MSGLVLIDRLIYRNPALVLSSRNVHRLVITAVLIVAKARDDVYFSNKMYASIGGITTAEMNYLETEFLQLIDWDIHVSMDDYKSYVGEIAMRYGPLTGNAAALAVAAQQEIPTPTAAPVCDDADSSDDMDTDGDEGVKPARRKAVQKRGRREQSGDVEMSPGCETPSSFPQSPMGLTDESLSSPARTFPSRFPSTYA